MKNRVDKSLSIISLIVFLFLFSCGSEHYYLRRGISYYNGGQYDQAISEFTRALEINPKLKNAYYNRGTVYWAKSDYDNAISDFNKALEIDPRDSDAYISRGGVYVNKGLPYQAISEFNKAIELDPNSVEAYFNRGVAYAKKGQPDYGTIVGESSSSVIMAIQEILPSKTESPLEITLAQSLLKGEKMDYLIQKSTELGVREIVPFFSSRSIPLLEGSKRSARLRRWMKIAIEASKQCGRGVFLSSNRSRNTPHCSSLRLKILFVSFSGR